MAGTGRCECAAGSFVIPGRRAAANPESILPVVSMGAERGHRGYGFRVRAKARPGMTNLGVPELRKAFTLKNSDRKTPCPTPRILTSTCRRSGPTPTPRSRRCAGRRRSHSCRSSDRPCSPGAPTGGTDLCKAFALPLSAECLKDITGLTNMRFEDMDAWSQAMIDGIANYSGHKEVEARCHAATSGIDAAIDDMIPVVTKHPNSSILSALLT